jgi:hypothetical protein
VAKTYVFTIAEHFYKLVWRINRWGGTAANYLTPAQVTDLNQIADSYDAHWGPSSGSWVPFRQQP